ncbi:hypothetical protein D3C72_1946170 [compost metagenome]
MVLAQAGDDRFDAIVSVEHAHITKALAALANPGIYIGIGLGGKDGGERPAAVNGERRAPCVHAIEMRREHDGGGITLQLFERACHPGALFHRLLWRKPQPAAIEPSLTEDNKTLFNPLRTLGKRCLRKAQFQIAQGNFSARRHQIEQDAP